MNAVTPLNDRTAQMLAELTKETVGERIQRLQAEAKSLALDHIRALTSAITFAEDLAQEIANGGEAYPAGIRDLARRFAEDAEARVNTLEALAARN